MDLMHRRTVLSVAPLAAGSLLLPAWAYSASASQDKSDGATLPVLPAENIDASHGAAVGNELNLKTIQTRTEGAVLYATIDSKPLNLVETDFVLDLVTLIEALDRGDRHRVVVFTSADPDLFISDVYLEDAAKYHRARARLAGEAAYGLLLRRLSTTKAVTIAQVNGRVRGAGNEFILSCDMRFASREKAIFGQLKAGFGLGPGADGVHHLARLLGRGRALEAVLSADDYDAERAEHYGWINRALPDAELAPFVTALARRIASFPMAGLMANKDRINAITVPAAADDRDDSNLFGKG